jgi:hypothetical protein
VDDCSYLLGFVHGAILVKKQKKVTVMESDGSWKGIPPAR